MAKENLDRQLIEYARAETKQYAQGEMNKLSTYPQLGKKFDRGRDYVGRLLKTEGIVDDRNKAKQEYEALPFPPSEELAWIVGYLGCQAHISTEPHTTSLRMTEDNPDKKKRFLASAQTIFPPHTINQLDDTDEQNRASTRDSRSIRKLGNIGRQHFLETFEERYTWILEDPRFRWAFIDGVTEQRGSLDKESVRYITSVKAFAEVIHKALQMSGINKSIMSDRRSVLPDRSWMVGIFNREDMRTFAQNIHSATPEKEALLESIREAPPVNARPVDALQEWQKLKQDLGHSPSLMEVSRLRKAGKTRFSEDVYRRLIGDRVLSTATFRLKQFDELAKTFSKSRKRKQMPEDELIFLLGIVKNPNMSSVTPKEIEAISQHISALYTAQEYKNSLLESKDDHLKKGITEEEFDNLISTLSEPLTNPSLLTTYKKGHIARMITKITNALDVLAKEHELKIHGRAHHWIIESPNGATSEGTCKICGIKKDFRNSEKDEFNKFDRVKGKTLT